MKKIVMSGANSLDLLPFILIILYIFIEQAKDCIGVIRKILREERGYRGNENMGND